MASQVNPIQSSVGTTSEPPDFNPRNVVKTRVMLG